MGTADKVATSLKLEQPKFSACLAFDASQQFVSDSQQLAKDLGVTGTPTLFINGQRLHAHDAGEGLKVELERRLGKKG